MMGVKTNPVSTLLYRTSQECTDSTHTGAQREPQVLQEASEPWDPKEGADTPFHVE